MTGTDASSDAAAQTPKIAHDGLKVLRDADRQRYELWHDEQYIGFLGYTVDEVQDEHGQPVSVVRLQHTIIDEKFSRRGYARALVTMVLDRLRAEGDRISPECSYVEHYLQRYPEYRDMVHQL